MNTSLHIKKDDKVTVLSGRDKGKIGRVLRVIPESGRAIVEKINMVKRHTRPNQKGQGGIVEREAPIHVSNLQVVCGKCGKATRTGVREMENGKRSRVCKKCGEILES